MRGAHNHYPIRMEIWMVMEYPRFSYFHRSYHPITTPSLNIFFFHSYLKPVCNFPNLLV